MADPRLTIRIGAELGEIKRALNTLSTDLQGFKKQADGAGQRVGAGMRLARNAALQLGVALAGVFSVRAIARMSDEAAELRARLTIATKGAEQFNRALDETYNIAQRTRTSWRATAELYARIERSTRQIGLNQSTILQLTETINKAGQLGGGGPGFEAALLQFGQALQSGDLSAVAQEMNSIQEQAPRLAEAIVKGLKELGFEGSNSLKKLVSEGGVEVQDLLRAILTQVDEVDEEFSKLPVTIGGAFQRVSNAFTKLVGDADTASGASAELTGAINNLVELLNDPRTKEGLTTLATGLARILGIITEATVEFAEFGRQIGLMAARVTGNISPLDDLEAQIKDVDRALKNSFMGKPTKYLFTSEEELNRIRAQLVAERDALLAAQGLANRPADKPAEQVGIPDGPTTTTEKASAYRADLELLRDNIARSLAELDRLYDANKRSLADYFAEKQRLQTADIDAAIEQARAELAVADKQEAQAKALAAIEVLQRDRAEVGARIARDQAAAEEALAKALGEVHIRLLEAQGETMRARTAQLEEEFRDLIVRLQAEGDTAGVALVRKLINVEAAKAELQQIADQVGQTIAHLRGTEELLAAQDEAGQLSPFAAEEQLQALRERSIEQLTRYRAALDALYAKTQDPAVLAQLQAVDTELARIEASQRRLENNIKEQAVQSLAGFFSDLATGAKSLGDAFRDFVRSFVQGVAQMIAQELALKAVRGILSAFGGGSIPVQHAGGLAGSGPRRRVDAGTLALFAGAPRFHTGGLPGLRADEVPAILQRGEEVLSKGDPRNVLNGGGRTGPGTGTRVINVLDPSLVQDYLDSPDGEEAILNVIGRNPGRVKQVLD